MKPKVERIISDIFGRLADWQGLDSAILAESADTDLLDPYFFISIDVYYRGVLLGGKERMKRFSEFGAFESSRVTAKDRFLVEDVAVRIEYKDIGRIDEILRKSADNMLVFRQTGTYMFYRLANGKVIEKRSDWIEEVRAQLAELPDSFWRAMAEAGQATMEHYVGDLVAAVMREDPLFYIISLAGFIKSFLSLLFIVNRQFEPSGRRLLEASKELPELPENFKGRFECILREDPQFPPSRKREIAELLAKSLIRMC